MKLMARYGVVLVAVLALGLVARPVFASTQDFTIQSFTADYYLSRDAQKNSQLRVEEKIVADFPETDQNHGILRAIPARYDGHDVNLKVQKVTDGNGSVWNYSESSSSGNDVLKIGDADRYVHGLQTYVIDYTMQNVTKNYSDHDEFYWDVNGDQWQQDVSQVTARVHLAGDVASAWKHDLQRCFTGSYGSTAQDCQITSQAVNGETVITVQANQPQAAGQTLSLVLGFQPSTFATYHMPLSQLLLMIAGVVFLGILPPILALVIMIRKWRAFGRDAKSRGVIVPQYLPPQGVSVLASSAVLKQKFVPAAVSAQIIDLAVRHYYKIYETEDTKKGYEIELVKDPADLGHDERLVADMLSGKGATLGKRIAFNKLANKLYTQAKAIGSEVVGEVTRAGYFKKNPVKVKIPYIAVGVILLFLGFTVFPFTLGLLLAGIILLIGAQFMPARTQSGVELHDYLLGLRDYMKLAEADRLKVLQSPHGELTEKIDVGDKIQLIKLYERLLPYAMLFGIEKDWAKELAALYVEPPEWYSGSTTFNAIMFATALNNFNSVSTASFTPPSNSGGSGFSGGGGFAGGGGGGGGGGGW